MTSSYPPPDAGNWAGVTVEEALNENVRIAAALRESNNQLRGEWQSIRLHNQQLETYLCECISLLAQHDIAPPDPTDERVKAVLQEKFINAIKGN